MQSTDSAPREPPGNRVCLAPSGMCVPDAGPDAAVDGHGWGTPVPGEAPLPRVTPHRCPVTAGPPQRLGEAEGGGGRGEGPARPAGAAGGASGLLALLLPVVSVTLCGRGDVLRPSRCRRKSARLTRGAQRAGEGPGAGSGEGPREVPPPPRHPLCARRGPRPEAAPSSPTGPRPRGGGRRPAMTYLLRIVSAPPPVAPFFPD